jgi:hypothetical protein
MKSAAAALLLVLSLLHPARAEDRVPTPDERARIEAALHSAGFQKWEEINWDDDAWGVEDAVAADGQEYYLRLDPNTFAIIEREKE